MDPTTWLTVLAPAAGLLWLFGLIGASLAERLGTRRLVGAVVFGLLLGPAVLGRLAPEAHRYLFVGAAEQHAALVDKQQAMHEAIEAAEASGVSESYIPELRERYEAELDALRQSVDTEQTRRRNTLGAVLGAPCLLVALFITIGRLAAPAARPRLGEHLQVMLAGALVSAAAAAGIGLWLINTGWVDTAGLTARGWLIGLAACCAVPAIPDAGADPAEANPLWRWLFEPLLYALAGSQTALFADFNGLLILAALFLFGDFKALGALLVMRVMRQVTWTGAMRTATLVAAGNAPALAIATVLAAAGAITGPVLTAVVLANVACAALAPVAIRMIDQFPPPEA